MSKEKLFSQEAEVGLLNIILLNPDLVHNLTSVRAFMFNSAPHQTLYSVIEELANQGLVPETSLVLSYLTSSGKLGAVGGKATIDYLSGQDYNRDNLKEFERQIVESYRAKSLKQVATNISSMVDDVGAEDAISRVRAELDSLTEFSGGDLTKHIKDILGDAWDSIIERVKNPGIRGVTTGFKDVDLSTGGFCAGDTWVIAARSSVGKTAWLCNSALATARSGAPVLVFQLEMSALPVIDRFMALMTDTSISDIRLGALTQPKIDAVAEAMNQLKEYPLYIDTNFNTSLNYIVSTIRRYHKSHKIRVVFLDYIQLLAERTSEQTAELGRISRAFKLLANELGITIVYLSQLNRGVEARDDKRPVLSDLRQSGNLEEDADVACFLFRESYYDSSKSKGIMEFIIRKQRNGPIGTMIQRFEETTNKIMSS